MPVYQSLYVKAGMSTIDVITKEDADHEGSYADASLDGFDLGIGFKGNYGAYVWKVAYEETDFDTLSLTSTTSNTISADIDTQQLAVSVGYRF